MQVKEIFFTFRATHISAIYLLINVNDLEISFSIIIFSLHSEPSLSSTITSEEQFLSDFQW